MFLASQLDRMSTGIEGLDHLVEGGFPFPSVILVCGSPGTGKTTFAQKFLAQGAANDEQCLYFTTLSEPSQCMLRYATTFDFLDRSWFESNIIYDDLGHRIRDMSGSDLLKYIDDRIADLMPQRIVIDPISVVKNLLRDDYRLFLFDLTTRLKNWQATTVLTGEVEVGGSFPTELAYSADGVILLTMAFNGDATRKYLEVIKMRGTNHANGKYSFIINAENGLTILRTKF